MEAECQLALAVTRSQMYYVDRHGLVAFRPCTRIQFEGKWPPWGPGVRGQVGRACGVAGFRPGPFAEIADYEPGQCELADFHIHHQPLYRNSASFRLKLASRPLRMALEKRQ